MSPDICIILNPHAGGGGGERTKEVENALTAAELDAEIRPMSSGQSPRSAAKAAISHGFGTVVAAGGDGTISGVADAVVAAGSVTRLGVLPFGTFNYFARSIGLPPDPSEAAAVLKRGRTQDMRLGSVNGRVFINNMSLGLYPSILENREDLYARWGRSRLAAYWSVLKTVSGFNRPMRLCLRLDGREERMVTPLIFIAASAYQLENYNLEGADAVREGRLALFAVRETRGTELMRSAWALARGRAREGEEFEARTAREIEIVLRKDRVLVARDGEREWMQSPLRVSRTDKPIPVIVAGAS